MPSVKISSARLQDDKELIDFSSQFPSEGGLKLALDRSPSYFDSLLIEGDISDVILGRDAATEKIVGLGHRTEANYFLNGKLVRLGYLSGLRLQKEYRSGLALARGYQKLKELHNKGSCRGYITTIQSENKHAIQVLESGRAGLPTYSFITQLTTLIWNPKICSNSNKFRIEKIREPNDIQFIRTHEVENVFLKPELKTSILSSNAFSHFQIKDDEKVIASFSFWDQRALKRWKVLGYSMTWRYLRIPYNLYARFRKLPSLPKPGEDIPYIFLSQLRILNSENNLLSLIFPHIFQTAQIFFPKCHLCYTLSNTHPWFQEVYQFPAWKISSKAYFVHWPTEKDNFSIPEEGVSIWEAGLL